MEAVAALAADTGKPKALLAGSQLVTAGLLLSLANFVAVLDMTIANVSVPQIAGGLAVSSSEGTYVITSYAVAEAITVPLTGWLAARFGTLRVFTVSLLLFGVFSLLCGLSYSLGFLVAGRILQGLSGGPLMPMSQTLLMRIFPKEKQAMALGLWSMTTLVAPILGPVVGGYICDNWGWPFIFYINVPVTVACSLLAARMLRGFETATVKARIDIVGLGLLVVWVSAMQIMLDQGKDLDWFSSPIIVGLAVTAVIGFAAFIIWELTDSHPAVDLRVFLHRGFTSSVFTICLAFGAFFGSVVLMPQWLQGYMGYSATWSGYVSAMTGVLAVLAAPAAAVLSSKTDGRMLVFMGVLWMGLWTLARAFNTTDMGYAQIAGPLFMQGIGLPFFFVPLTAIALASVKEEETASASGLMNFARTVSGAFATSLVMTKWEDGASGFRNELAGKIGSLKTVENFFGNGWHVKQKAVGLVDQMVQSQSVMLSTNHIFLVSSAAFLFAAAAIWFAPKPARAVDMSAVH